MEGNCFKKMAAQELEEREKYDVITAIQVNHYLSEAERKSAVRKCCQALKAGGIFFHLRMLHRTAKRVSRLF